ncbi:MAG: hypothetical protein IPM03_00635 [Sulfuritalea sp.]|nr:hypothetical protein [Sulfuritalea sp.]
MRLRRVSTFALAVTGAMGMPALAQQSRMVEAYEAKHAERVLDRSVFYGPRQGGVYRAKFEARLRHDPNVKGVVIHNHGCGGMWGLGNPCRTVLFPPPDLPSSRRSS